ncbi:hypothetical protein EDC04DRAFT_2608263 [Pisolithus marmoratus]|nr:hypothetical protein EDC04DRAFT_2608263 [Pisolithus marmoratus]
MDRDNDYLVEDEMGEAEEQLVDEGAHDVPFNIADSSSGQQLVTADAHTQRDVHLGLYEQQPASGVKGIWMSTLWSMHDNKQAMAAVGILRQWHQIMMDGEEWMQQLHNQRWTTPGIHESASIQPSRMDDGTGDMYGQTAIVVMVLNMYFEEGYGENREEEVPVLELKTMALSMEHQYMMIMFITHVLDLMQHKDIHCIEEYLEPLTLESIKASMEVL